MAEVHKRLAVSDVPKTLGQWFRLTLVYHGLEGTPNGLRVYHYAVEVGTPYTSYSSYDNKRGNDRFVLGREKTNIDNNYGSAVFDELMLWNEALSLTDIEALNDLA